MAMFDTKMRLLLLLTLPMAAVGGGSSSSNAASLNQPFTASFSRLNHAACVSLFYRNGRIGCGTGSNSAQVGHLQYFDGENLPETDKAYVAVMDDYQLQASPLSILMNELPNGLLKGVLVLNSTSSNEEVEHWYSPEPQYPQGYGTPSENLNYGNAQFAWNSMGSGVIQYDLFGLPMAYVIDSDVSNSLRDEAQDESANGDIVAEFTYYMGPEETNSMDCLAWKDANDDKWNPKCLPLGGSSVWAAAGPPPGQGGDGNQGQAKPVFVVGASMDTTGLFHDLSHGSNAAASNILVLLMAAKLVGGIGDNALSELNGQIVFALFQAEAHGFVGSRSFFRDLAYPGFQCNSDQVYAVPRLEQESEYACLDPLYPSLKFSKLGNVYGMLSVDQLGTVTSNGYFYVHADQNNDYFGKFLANVLKYGYTKTSSFQVADTSAYQNGGNNGYPYPPTPLTSLLSLSEGAVGGAVLSGYDHSFSKAMPYHSFRDSAYSHSINLKAIAGAATIVARAAVAAAYDGNSGNYDYASASQYAAELIPELDYNEGALVALANCLLYNGNCADLNDYSSVRARNEKGKSGFGVSSGVSLGKPPNFYAGVYNEVYGQPFVKVGDQAYGRYTGEDFGKATGDAISMQPTVLENAVHGLLDDFLGRGSANFKEKKCKKQSDCQNVGFCQYQGESPTCTGGGVCVCSRANFHRALDEGLEAAEDMPTGYFVVSDNDQGVSPMYTEPYWSSRVGVRVYRDVGPLPGLMTLVSGAFAMATSLCAGFLLRAGLKKQKLY